MRRDPGDELDQHEPGHERERTGERSRPRLGIERRMGAGSVVEVMRAVLV